MQNWNRTEFSTEKIRIEQKYEQNLELDQNKTENITEFRITTKQSEKTANSKQNRIQHSQINRSI